MRKETIEFTDYNGEARSQDFYFNLDAAEITILNLKKDGGMESYINKIINESDQEAIIDLFCDIIEMSYGVKKLDGGFEKSDDHFRKFRNSAAYSVLFMKLATDAEFAAQFINDIMPTPQPQSGDRNVAAVEQAKKIAMEKAAEFREARKAANVVDEQ